MNGNYYAVIDENGVKNGVIFKGREKAEKFLKDSSKVNWKIVRVFALETDLRKEGIDDFEYYIPVRNVYSHD
jgi:hypothetical protein